MFSRKRLFLGLLLALEFLIAIGLFILWYIPYRGFENLGKDTSIITAWAFGSLLILFSIGIVLLFLTILRGKEIPGTRMLRGPLIRLLLPAISAVGKIFGIPKDDIRQSFIEINNELVRFSTLKTEPERVLILMPHCIQRDMCSYRITTNVANCRHCGKCDFSELTSIAAALHVEMTVATGGTLARRVIVETNPDVIIAVACERDLSSGIADAYPIPVLGILIDRPQGPCLNTRVDVEKVRRALQVFLPEGKTIREKHHRKAAFS